MSTVTYPIHTTPLTRENESDAALQRLMRRFPPGSLVTIQWSSTGQDYDPDEHGMELDDPEPALLLKSLPEHAFMSLCKGWVIPFECVHKGTVRVSTTYAAEVIGRMPKPGER